MLDQFLMAYHIYIYVDWSLWICLIKYTVKLVLYYNLNHGMSSKHAHV